MRDSLHTCDECYTWRAVAEERGHWSFPIRYMEFPKGWILSLLVEPVGGEARGEDVRSLGLGP